MWWGAGNEYEEYVGGNRDRSAVAVMELNRVIMLFLLRWAALPHMDTESQLL